MLSWCIVGNVGYSVFEFWPILWTHTHKAGTTIGCYSLGKLAGVACKCKCPLKQREHQPYHVSCISFIKSPNSKCRPKSLECPFKPPISQTFWLVMLAQCQDSAAKWNASLKNRAWRRKQNENNCGHVPPNTVQCVPKGIGEKRASFAVIPVMLHSRYGAHSSQSTNITFTSKMMRT